MAGKKGQQGRVGRYKRQIEDLIGDNRHRACVLVNRYLANDDIPLIEKIPYAMQIAIKLMPDKVEVVSLSLSLDTEVARKLVEMHSGNSLLSNEIRKARLAKAKAESESIPEVEVIPNKADS